MIQGLRIPIIRLQGNLIVPIQIDLSDDLVQQLKDDITAAIERYAPRGLVVDVSGIGVMDTFITRTIRDVALIAKLMGTKTLISGLDPMVAITLVEMGMDLSGIDTAMHLEAALERLQAVYCDDSDLIDKTISEALGLNEEGRFLPANSGASESLPEFEAKAGLAKV